MEESSAKGNAILSQNLKELHQKCDAKGSWDTKNNSCQKCRTGHAITGRELQSVPDNCPILDSCSTLIPTIANIGTSYDIMTKNALEAYQRVQNGLIKQQLAIINATQNALVGSAFSALNIYETFTKSITRLVEATKFLDEDEFKRFEYNWVSFLTIGDIKALYKMWKEGNEDGVRQVFLDLFNSEKNISQLISLLAKNPVFKQRMHIIKDALFAHLEGRYSLSIPVLWSQIDGIFLNVFGKLLSGKSEKCEMCNRPFVFPNAKNIAKELLPQNSEFMPAYLKHIARSYSHERAGISHGLDIQYPCPNRSTKLILSLLVLYYSLERRNKDPA